jgi:hypothetical protein
MDTRGLTVCLGGCSLLAEGRKRFHCTGSIAGLGLARNAREKIATKDTIMALEAHDVGNRPEPGLGLALLTVLVMVLTTAVLSGLIYVLMLGVAATSAGSRTAPTTVQQPAAVSPASPDKK